MQNKTILCLCSLLTTILSACNGGGASSSVKPQVVNQVPVVVGIGNTNNLPSIDVTVCQPNTTICQTFDKILLDTGSFGLKINRSAFNQVNLPAINQTGSNLPISVCNLYGSGYVFATANYADVYIGGEKAANLPMQIIDDGNQANVPSSCANQGALVDFHTLGMNGIIGVNPMVKVPNTSNYNYTCQSGSCTKIFSGIPVANLNVNPVASFAQDNNGEFITLPAVSPYSATPVYGVMTFGLNTESNNQLPANVSSVKGDPHDFIGRFLGQSESSQFTTLYDTGTNYLYFYSDLIPYCDAGFYVYCPSTTMMWKSTVSNYDGSGNPLAISLPIAPITYTTYPVEPQFGTYASPGDGIYGLPFFLGKSVYMGFVNYQTSMGNGPTWGYQ